MLVACCVDYAGGPYEIRLAISVGSTDSSTTHVESLVSSVKSPLGNRNCLHQKLDWSNVSRLAVSKKPINPTPSRPWLLFSTVGLPYTYFTSVDEHIVCPQYVTEGYFVVKHDQEVVPYPGGMEVTHVEESFWRGELQMRITIVSRYTAVEDGRYVARHREVENWWPWTTPTYSSDDLVISSQWCEAPEWYCPSMLTVKNWLAEQTGDALVKELPSWGALANNAVDASEALNSNMIQYLMELRTLKSLADPIQAIGKGIFTKRTVASAWLSYNYGIRLTVRDTYAAVAAIVRSRKHGISDHDVVGTRSPVNVSLREGLEIAGYRNLMIYYGTIPSFILDSWRTLRRWGLYPTTEMAWDFVPFSFVVDWFVPLGDVLRAADNEALLSTYNVLESLRTTKLTYSIDAALLSGGTASGILTYRVYERNWYFQAPKPEAQFSSISLSKAKLINGTALIFQKMK